MESVKAKVSFPLQFMLLAERCAKSTWRNPLNFKGRLAQTLFLSIVFGLVFLRLDNDLKGVQSRLGSLFFLCVQCEWRFGHDLYMVPLVVAVLPFAVPPKYACSVSGSSGNAAPRVVKFVCNCYVLHCCGGGVSGTQIGQCCCAAALQLRACDAWCPAMKLPMHRLSMYLQA